MPWFKVDDKFHSHPKVMELTPSAVGLWTLAGAWCADYLTDGFIRKGQIRRLGGSEEESQQLVDAGLWEPVEGGWQFRDWHEYQPTADSVKQGRDDKSRGGRLSAHNRWHKGKGKSVADCEYCDSSTYKTSYSSPISDRWDTPWDSDAPVPEPVPEVPKGTSSPKPPKPRKKPETSIPDDWTPTDAHKTKAHEKGVDLHQQAEAFRLHAETHDRRCVNWNSAFSMWLSKARPDTGPKQYQNAAEKKVEVARHWLSQPTSQAPADPWAIAPNPRKEIEE